MNALTLATAPHLFTANTNPLEELEMHILDHRDDIEISYCQQFQNFHIPYNVVTIQDYISLAGYHRTLGTLREDIKPEKTINLPARRTIKLNKIHRNENTQISIGDFTPCAELLNNGLCVGLPDIPENIQQPPIPPLDLGWSNLFYSYGVIGHMTLLTNVRETKEAS